MHGAFPVCRNVEAKAAALQGAADKLSRDKSPSVNRKHKQTVLKNVDSLLHTVENFKVS